MPSGEEIQKSLRTFVKRWQGYAGTEKSEAQTFLNELFAAYGTDRREVGAEFEFFAPQAGFMDLHWPGLCLIEMKAPGVPVTAGREQVQRYRNASSDIEAGQPAARWVVICNFEDVEVWQPGDYPLEPVARFPVAELPDRYDALAFLTGPNVEPSFAEHHRELTKEAAAVMAEVFHSLVDRVAASPREIHRFILQSVWCMFAEDLGMLDDYPFDKTLRAVRDDPERSLPELTLLFSMLNKKRSPNRKGRLAGTAYVNGDLFAEPAEVELQRDEIDLLIRAGGFDWRQVDPTIFGSLLEGVLGHEQRWRRGAHYTHEVDILKIVTPTIIRPWRERIDAATTPQQARDLLDELCRFRVLDPACGCGNFLYIAYRELRGLEAYLKEKTRSLAADTGLPVPDGDEPYYPLRNLQGIDIEPTAVQLARVTLWMGHRQMIERYGEAEPPLPLQDLSSVREGDALRIPWPETDCIIGNPPFLGSQHVRGQFGDTYTEWLKKEFGVGVKDFCTYWFRRAADHLQPGQRAGLVATNSVSQNRARSVSLDYMVDGGGVITDAIASQKWPGEAKVHVSIVNWIDDPTSAPTVLTLDGASVEGINTSLRPSSPDDWTPVRLQQNAGLCFQGPIPVGAGFVLERDEAHALLSGDGAEYRDVVRPYLIGEDMGARPMQDPSRWIIDFGVLPLEAAAHYSAVIRIVRERVKPERELNRRRARRERWWQFGENARGMRAALDNRQRYIAGSATGKRLLLAWQSAHVCPSNLNNVFAFDDDYSMGILLSCAHKAWAWLQSSTLKGDLRYTPTSVFMTFPWPDPVTDEHRERVAEASRRLLARRTEICTGEQIGLTTLYNQVDDGAWTDLAALHRELDEAVAECYGWPTAIAQDDRELVKRLTELNRAISEGERSYAPFG